MLESLFNKLQTWTPEDYCKTYLLHALLRFYFSLGKILKNFINLPWTINFYELLKNVKWKAMFTKGYLQLSRISTMELFSLWLNQNFENVLHFLHNSPFRENGCNCENFGRSLINNRTIFIFEIRNYAMKWHHQWRFFKLASVKSQKQSPGGVL